MKDPPASLYFLIGSLNSESLNIVMDQRNGFDNKLSLCNLINIHRSFGFRVFFAVMNL